MVLQKSEELLLFLIFGRKVVQKSLFVAKLKSFLNFLGLFRWKLRENSEDRFYFSLHTIYDSFPNLGIHFHDHILCFPMEAIKMLWTFEIAITNKFSCVDLNLCIDNSNSISRLFFAKLNINSILLLSTWLCTHTIPNRIFLRPHSIALKAIKHEICGLNAGKNE